MRRIINWRSSNQRNNHGDTIVEVLISLAVLAAVLGGGYGLTSNSLQNGIEAGQRSEALAVAQGQIEFVKDAQASGGRDIKDYQIDKTFCIDSDTGDPIDTDHSDYEDICNTYEDTDYSVGVDYDDASGKFTVGTNWPTFRGEGINELQLNYKLAIEQQP